MLKKQPEVTMETKSGSTETCVHRHDAFGVIVMTAPTGGNRTLFGSDIGHAQTVRIEIRRAVLSRGCHDTISSAGGRPLVSFELSHAQFSRFITSNGNGCGTPVTLEYAPAPGAAIERMPAIEKIETKHDTHRRNIGDMAKKTMQNLSASIERLESMLAGDKLNKAELRDIHRQMTIAMGNVKSNMEYVVESAEEALEQATSDAKIEVESFVSSVASRLGLSHVNDLLRLDVAPSAHPDEDR